MTLLPDPVEFEQEVRIVLDVAQLIGIPLLVAFKVRVRRTRYHQVNRGVGKL
jgi:hypothetical protein